MKKVLFIGMHRPNRSPSQRYRFEQYFSFLEENGINCNLAYLISEDDDKILYRKGRYFAKLGVFLKSIRKRKWDVARAKTYDYIFIQREAFMTGTTYFEKKLSQLGIPLIYDFDDAIWLADENDHHGILGLLKKPTKTKKLISLADKVIAGNDYLAKYASQFNNCVEIIPTTIDTNLYKAKTYANKQLTSITIGWTGSFSTIKHFEEVVPVLTTLKEKYGERVNFKVIGDPDYRNTQLGITGQKWQAETEVEDLQSIDIGIMPLPDNEWTRGKCGAKGLQYMALEIPTIMSPIGVNKEIIQDGINGFLADTTIEWVDKLSRLIESPELRNKLGAAGRKTVVARYSVEANKKKYLKLFEG